MATQLKKIVKADGSGDYTTLEACMHANEQDLVANDKYFDVEIDGVWPNSDTTQVDIHNYTYDATHYINIYTTAAARHNGTAQSVSGLQNYRLEGVRLNIEGVNPTHVTITGLEIFGYAAGGSVTSIVTLGPSYVNSNRILDGLLIHDCTGRSTAINIAGSNVTNTVRNTIIYNFPDAYSRGIAGAMANLYNNTVYKVGTPVGQLSYGYGLWIGNGDGLNNIAIECGGASPLDFRAYTPSATKDYNISSDASAAGGNSLINQTAANLFVNVTPGAEDLHLKAGANAIDKGKDLSAKFTDDIDGTTRVAPWDIGADEWVSGAPAYPTSRLKKGFVSGYHCFMNAYLNAKVGGAIPLKLPDGTVF